VGGASIGLASSAAFIWDAAHGMRPLKDVLVTDYGLGPALQGWTLLGANGLSSDGKHIIGIGTNPGGQRDAWIVDLDAPAPPPQVVARHVFYNHSVFDGNDAAAGAADDAAVATDKVARMPGQRATFANVTSFDRGINGVMVDIEGLPAGDGPTPDDFEIGADGTRAISVSVRRGAGTGGSDRVTLLWPDFNTPTDPPTLAVGNGWLTVTVKANAHTGLAAPDVFSFGNLIGDADGTLRVNALDLAAVRRALSTAPITSPTDFNRDGRTNALDLATVKRNLGHSLPTAAAPVAIAALRTDRRVADEVLFPV
jgi:hypothetical protein